VSVLNDAITIATFCYYAQCHWLNVIGLMSWRQVRRIFLPELSGIPGKGGHNSVQALEANGMRARQQLWGVFPSIVHT